MFFIHHAYGRKLNSHINIIVLLVSKRVRQRTSARMGPGEK